MSNHFESHRARHVRRFSATMRMLVCTGLLFIAMPALGQSPPRPATDATLGANLDELLRRVREFNPELAMMALEREAAVARAQGADSLPDPTFRTSFEDIDRRRGSYAPQRVGSIFYSIEQEFPLWGKRDLRRNVALAEVRGTQARELATGLELATRVKVAYAQYYQAMESIRVTEEIQTLLTSVANVAQARVAQGVAGQQDALRIEAERTTLTTTLANFERDRRMAQAKLNALLDRPAGSPLVQPLGPRPIPPAQTLRLDELIDRALTGNPTVAGNKADIAAAEGMRSLAERAWYPDVTLGLTAVDRERQFTGYEAMIEFKIPLQWGLKESELRAASARFGASGRQLQSTKAKLRGEIEEAYWGLETTRRVEELLRNALSPQFQAAYRASLAAYQQGRSELLPVIEAEQKARQVRLDVLKVLTEQQTLLGEIERLIGGEL